jgi:hypothetical protein
MPVMIALSYSIIYKCQVEQQFCNLVCGDGKELWRKVELEGGRGILLKSLAGIQRKINPANIF